MLELYCCRSIYTLILPFLVLGGVIAGELVLLGGRLSRRYMKWLPRQSNWYRDEAPYLGLHAADISKRNIYFTFASYSLLHVLDIHRQASNKTPGQQFVPPVLQLLLLCCTVFTKLASYAHLAPSYAHLFHPIKRNRLGEKLIFSFFMFTVRSVMAGR